MNIAEYTKAHEMVEEQQHKLDDIIEEWQLSGKQAQKSQSCILLLKNQSTLTLIIMAKDSRNLEALFQHKHTHLSKSGFVSADTNPNSERGQQGQPNSDLKEKEIPLWFYQIEGLVKNKKRPTI